jgi:chromosomal replication initiator protein
VLEFIASRISTNIRELEGALIRVTAFANLNRQSVDPAAWPRSSCATSCPTTRRARSPRRRSWPRRPPTSGSRSTTCRASRAHRVLVTARQIAMYLCRELTDMSLPKIGQQFGGRDHTTVMHADKKIRQLMAERRAIYNQVTELTNRIKQQSN